ncbi:nuclear transport factor 2 family protein [Frigidibacter sp. ROC022]|uniref:nuclear transport factor 2 family protein n=1 Tax=Frigidibacter sp. ROC022 TaxID=2971796 RepID=UPI00215A30C8|nr:nuclear transport factor 2 family protein [Frigidibacter sp. ROC022]MCR8722992.1 nuclear transport factor 2 family protein [Frigidibacter sp. ROC022]
MPALDIARRLIRAIEVGDVETLRVCYHPDLVQIEWPNRLYPQGQRRGLADIETDFARGSAILRRQSYEITNELDCGDKAMLEIHWTATLNAPLGEKQPGDEIDCRIAAVFDTRDGRIIGQRNYDCYPPF